MVRSGVRTINITLKDENSALSEVVVVGYGTQKKANLSGSVAHSIVRRSKPPYL